MDGCHRTKFLYRAGTEQGPVFDVAHRNDEFEDWLVTEPKLYLPFDQLPLSSGQSSRVPIWKADISHQPDVILTEAHNPDNPESIYNGVCSVKLKDSKKLKEKLRGLKWEKTSVEADSEGVSLMHFSTLVQAVVQHMKTNIPTSPEEFNFQAELKAACYWNWSYENGQSLERGPHDNIRVKIAARNTYQKWVKLATQSSSLVNREEGAEKADLEQGIFDLAMYYDDIEDSPQASGNPPRTLPEVKLLTYLTADQKRAVTPIPERLAPLEG